MNQYDSVRSVGGTEVKEFVWFTVGGVCEWGGCEAGGEGVSKEPISGVR